VTDIIRVFAGAASFLLLCFGVHLWRTRFMWRYQDRVFRTLTSYVLYNIFFLALLAICIFWPVPSP